jgi:phosphoketolase
VASGARNINTPLELAIRNQTDRFSLAIDAIDRAPRLGGRGAHVREALLDQQIACREYAYEFGIDPSEIRVEMAILRRCHLHNRQPEPEIGRA